MGARVLATGSGDIISELEREVAEFRPKLEAMQVGTVIEVGAGIARISGLGRVMAGELLRFSSGVEGIALSLEREGVKAIIIGDYSRIKEGETVRGAGRLVSVPAGEGLIGRVVDALGQPLDERGPIPVQSYMPVERVAPGVTLREPVRVPLQTGVLIVDALVPIGRGQRELVIGDRQTGKTTLALDMILNQAKGDIVCVYVAIGQKLSNIAYVVDTLQKRHAMGYTIVVVASASDPVALQYLAPYAGCAMAEYFVQKGQDVLVVYDDLSKHAWAYRQLSLLLRRPPGREAYPGDIFYLHSRLLERAGRFNVAQGGGSLTALPIIETQLGDISSYIPTNVISITDGQIYLEAELFHTGIRPALNLGLSVSRVGGAAQIPAMRQVAGRMRLDLAQYRELAAFAQFGSDLDQATRTQLNRGRRTTELLKQPKHAPQPVERQAMSVYLLTRGYLDDVPAERIKEFEAAFHRYMSDARPAVGQAIVREKRLSTEAEAQLQQAIKQFKESLWPTSAKSEGTSAP
jgi:F-type H+-transporting ATPase subunit alpha